MDRMSKPALPPRGLTLIEFFIALLILGVMLSVGGPSLRHALNVNWLRTETHRMLTSINLTRSEAVGRNTAVSMCPSRMAQTGAANCDGDFSSGWIIFSNPARESQPTDPERQLIRAYDGLPAGYTISNRAGTRPAEEMITYLPDGSSRRNRSLLICPPGGGDRPSRSIVMNVVGRPRVALNWGSCPNS